MAVLQISQIQVRKGHLQDLGQLAGGEFGWAVDKLRLFIGNGTLDEGSPYIGNTEILTEHSLRVNGLATFTYRFRGLLGGYDAQSGPTVLSPTLRSLQDKLDDFINVKDFGAVGDGFTDDLDAIQRAFDEVYNRLGAFTTYPTRRHVNFYPGVYVIYGELRLPPFTVLNGVGEGSVIIRQMSPAATCVIKSTTSTGIFDERIPVNGMPPGPIAINNITFENTFDRDIALFESASDVSLFRCKFTGNVTQPTTTSSSNGVAFKSSYLQSKSLKVVECDFSGSSTNLLLSSNIGVTDVSVTRCTFTNSYYGVMFTTFTPTPPHATTRITDNVFDSIAREGIRVEPYVRGVLTSTNTFLNVGRGQLATANPLSSVIRFAGNACYSIADVFHRNENDDYYFATVHHGSSHIVSTDATSQIKFGNLHQTIGHSITLNNNSMANVSLSPRFRQGRVFYSVQRNNKFRAGQIKFAVDLGSSSCEWRESYTEKDPVGIITSMTYGLTDGLTRPILSFRSDDRGTPSIITYDVKSDFNPAFLNAIAIPDTTPTTTQAPLANIDLYFTPATTNVNIAFSSNAITTLGNTYLFAANGTPMAFYPVTMTVNTAPVGSNVNISPLTFNIMSGEQREVFIGMKFVSPANDTTNTEFVYSIDATSGTEKATFTYIQNRITSTTTTTTTAAPGTTTTTSTTTTAAPGTTTTTSTTTTAAPGTTTTTSTTTTAAPGTTTTTSTTTTAAPGSTSTTTTTLSANPYASNLSFGQIDTGTVDGGGAPIYAQGYKFVDISNVTRVVINSKSEPSLTNNSYDTWSSTVETIYDSNVDAPLPASGQIRTFSGAHSGEAFFTGGTGKVGYRITVYHTTNPTWTSSATSSPTDYIRLGGTFGGGS